MIKILKDPYHTMFLTNEINVRLPSFIVSIITKFAATQITTCQYPNCDEEVREVANHRTGTFQWPYMSEEGVICRYCVEKADIVCFNALS